MGTEFMEDVEPRLSFNHIELVPLWASEASLILIAEPVVSVVKYVPTTFMSALYSSKSSLNT